MWDSSSRATLIVVMSNMVMGMIIRYAIGIKMVIAMVTMIKMVIVKTVHL